MKTEPAALAHEAIHETVEKIFGGLGRTGDVLDIPAGEGALAKRLSALGFNVRCADLYPEIFRLDGTEIERADLDGKLPYDDQSFDHLVCVEGLEHIEHPANAIREFARLIRPGGKLVVSVPNIMNIEERLRWVVSGYTSHFKPLSRESVAQISAEFGGMEEIALHVNPIGYSELRYLLENNGFTLIKTVPDAPKRKLWLFLPIVWMIRFVAKFQSAKKRSQRWADELNSDPVILGGNTLIFVACREEEEK